MFPWWSAVHDSDTKRIATQLGRTPRGVVAVARRCRFGSPQVIVTNPIVFGPGRSSERRAGVAPSEPRVFPTLFWLTCPYLVSAVSRLEGDGWVGRLKVWLEESGMRKRMAAVHERAAQERLAVALPGDCEILESEHRGQWQVLISSGVGGSREQAGVKCLHAHLADYLAGPVGDERSNPGPPGARNPIGARVMSLLLQRGVDITGWTGCSGCELNSTSHKGERFTQIVVMDVGTNSCRLSVAEAGRSGTVSRRKTALEATRLGEGLQKSGRLSSDAVRRTLRGLDALWSIAGDEPSVPERPGAEPHTQLIAVGTSALRSASNPEDFLVRAWEELGIAVRVLSGEEEANLAFRGALAGLRCCENADGPIAVLDIGGGSTELVVGERTGQVYQADSVSVGAVSLTELKAQLALADVVGETAGILADGLSPARSFLEGQTYTLVGVGGTCTSLAAIDLGLTRYDPSKVQGHAMERDRIGDILRHLLALPLSKRREVPGLQPERADIIIAGAAILLATMQMLEQDRILMSDSDLLLGIAEQFTQYYGACV